MHIQHKPGTDNMLINAMMRHILDRELHDAEFVESRCENFDAFELALVMVGGRHPDLFDFTAYN